MKNALAPLAVATLVLLAGCSARESRAATSPVPPSETQEAEKKSTGQEETQPKSGLSSVETTEERREGLEGKLDESLREFDGLILREQEILEERREESAPPPGAGGGAGDGSVEEAEEGEGGEASSNGGRTADAGGTGGSPDEPPEVEPVGSEESTTETSDAGELSNGRIPPDVGDGRDDDIVARQLREAAMSEEDPALREKLWDEYRAYKFGTKKKENE